MTADLMLLIASRPRASQHMNTRLPVHLGEAAHRILEEAAFFTRSGLRVAPAGFLRHRDTFALGPFRITPYLNDHSAFDAYSLLIEAGGKRLVAAVERGEGDDNKSYWTRIGVAFENRDGSWNLRFDYAVVPAERSGNHHAHARAHCSRP